MPADCAFVEPPKKANGTIRSAVFKKDEYSNDFMLVGYHASRLTRVCSIDLIAASREWRLAGKSLGMEL